jgi:hypothetical protein
MFNVCNPKPELVKEEDTTDGIVRKWQHDERIILVNPDHIISIHKDYYEEGYHLISLVNGSSVASDLRKRETI